MGDRHPFLRGARIDPAPINGTTTIVDLIDHALLAYNGARLREACQLFSRRILEEDVTVGMSVSGALTPAGLGMSAIVPLIEAGFVDWIVSTGANLYHDTHFAIGLEMHRGTPHVDDLELRKEKIVRIYDILFDFDILVKTDTFFRKVLRQPDFQRVMTSAEFHYTLGRYVREREQALNFKGKSVLSAAYEFGVPIYTSSPGDSAIGMNVAALAIEDNRLVFDVNRDVNETAAIVLAAKRAGGKSATVMLGGGSPKNFILQTEPQVQEVLGIFEKGHDYFVQITDARPDSGGLSGATPSEAVSWGKVDPEMLPSSVVCYADTTIALPLLTAYLLATHKPRQPRRLYDRLNEMYEALVAEYHRAHPQGLK